MTGLSDRVEQDVSFNSVWGRGQLLAMSGLAGKTDYAHGLVARTAFQGCGIQIEQPFRETVTFAEAEPTRAAIGGDFFVLDLPDGRVEGVFIDAHHLLIRGRCTVAGAAGAVHRAGDRTLIGVPRRFDPTRINTDLDAAIRQREAWFRSIELPSLKGPAHDALVKALAMIRTQTLSPEGAIPTRWTTPDRWPHRDMWLWDSVFHAIGLRHFDPQLAREAIDAVLSVQEPDGFIPHRASPVAKSDITQPPVLAFGVQQVLQGQSDLDWLRIVYPGLKAYLAWNQAHRDTDGAGLLEWFIEDDPRCRSGESGMDNSPRFDDAIQLDAVDFNAFMALEYRILADFADQLGHADEAASFRGQWKTLCNLINERLWNEKTGFYHDFDVKGGRQTDVLASSGFLPLLCGAPDAEQARRLAAHLTDPDTFGTPLPIPSVARCSRRGGDHDMWRGPVWININWLVAHAFEVAGFRDEAHRLYELTAAELIRQHARYGTFFEFYDDARQLDPPQLDRKGRNDPTSLYNVVIHDFGWSATLFIDLAYRLHNRLPSL